MRLLTVMPCDSDEAATYYKKLEGFAGHDTVAHVAGEYVRGDVHANTVEKA